MKCPQCRADVPAGARFCPECGHELVVVGDQRRIATVLFADLVGFTALSETLDPEQVKALVDRCFELLARDIEEFGGRVDKVMGDAIVALFGAPVAHEDDAERAVRAGLRMQETISSATRELGYPVRMRVGVNSGEVLVGAVRAGREYTAMGDVVNTASRLQTAAAPGTVLVGPDTRAATRDAVEYEAVDPIVAKGKALPVEAWVAIRAIAPPGQRSRRLRSPMVGREVEEGLLTTVASTAVHRSRAALLVVHGEAGMGKSRLAAEVGDHVRCELDAVVLEGRCVPYGEANVWWPVAEAVRAAAGVGADAPFAEIDAALRKTVAAALRETGRQAEVERVVAGLHHLLGEDGALRGIDAARAKEEAIRSVVALAEGFSYRQPLLVIVSDIHWAGDEVLDLLDTLLARLARRPLVLLATARRSLRERWIPAPEAANSVVLHLDPLDDDASHRLLAHLTEGALHPAMAAVLVDRAGGNPFYLEELVSLINEAGVGSVESLLGDGGDLPTTLRGLVAARLDALAPADRQLIDDAAVLGRRSKIDSLVTMANVKRRTDLETARAQVESLAAREFLVLDGEEYSFRSEVIREVAYSTLTKADRARTHADIAAWIEHHHDGAREHIVDQVASHYAAAAEMATDLGDVSGVPDDIRDRAVSWLLRAAVRAEGDSFPTTTSQLATRALDLAAADDPARQRLFQLRARARVQAYELEAALVDVAEAERAAGASGDERALGELGLIRAEAAQHRGDIDEALVLIDEAQGRFEALGHRPGIAEALRLRGMVHLVVGASSAADEALGAALQLFEELDDKRGRAWALQNLSWSAYIAGRIGQAEQWVEQAMSTFEELGDPVGLTWSRGLLAWVRFHQGRNEEAMALATETGADARERGEVWGEAMMTVLLASIALWSGRTLDSIEYGRAAVDLFGQIDDRMGQIQARCNLGRALMMSGDITAGFEQLALAEDPHGDGQIEHASLARVAVLSAAVQIGDEAVARTVVGEMDRFDRGMVGGDDRLGALATFHLQVGELAAAQELLAGEGEGRGYIDSVRVLASAVAGDLAGALRHADALEHHPHSYVDRLWSDIGRALVLTRAGRMDDAEAVLASARGAIDDTDDRVADAILALVDAELAEFGQRPDAATRRSWADHRLASIGIDGAGWRVLIGEALAVVPAS